MQITINLDSQADRRAALDLLLGLENAPLLSAAGEVELVATSPEPAPVAKKAAPPKAAAPKPVAPPKAVEEDLMGGEAYLYSRAKAAAVEAATELVTTGQSAKVREALTALSAKRVSDLSSPREVQAFLEAIA